MKKAASYLNTIQHKNRRVGACLRWLFILAAALFLLTACGEVFSEDKEVVLATGGTAGTYFAVGGTMATVLNPLLKNSSLSILSTGGSKANIQMLSSQEAQLAIVQNDVMYYAYTGTDLFSQDNKYDKVSAVAGLYDETIQIVTCDSGLKTISDLKGKIVSVGDAGSGVEFNSKQILEAYGMTFDDIVVVNASFGDSAEDLKSGAIDAAIIVAGAPTKAVADLAAEKQIYFIELDKEHIETLRSKYQFYTETVIPEGVYEGVSSSSDTVSVRAMLVASDKVSDEQVYELLKNMFEKKDILASGQEQFQQLSLEGAVNSVSIPFHKGAKKYYQEQGIGGF